MRSAATSGARYLDLQPVKSAAQGGDWGAFIASRLGYAHPETMIGIPRFRPSRQPTSGVASGLFGHPDIALRRLLVLSVRKGSTLRTVGSNWEWLLPAHRVLSL